MIRWTRVSFLFPINMPSSPEKRNLWSLHGYTRWWDISCSWSHCTALFPSLGLHRILINYCINFLHSTCGEISCIQVTEYKPFKTFKVWTSNFWFTNIIILFQFSIIISSPLSVSNVSFLSLNLYCFILTFVASLEEFYHVFENSEMKWKRVCMPNCYNPSVPRKSQSKKISFL